MTQGSTYLSVCCAQDWLEIKPRSAAQHGSSYLHYCFISVFLPEEASDMAPGSVIRQACLVLEHFRGGSTVITQCQPKSIRLYKTGFKINLLFSPHLDFVFNPSDLL